MKQSTLQPSTLVFSVAMNGYQWLYRDFIDSHRRYAHRFGYRHLVITRPAYTVLGVECCWLKLEVIKLALSQGYQDVLFVDADAYIMDGAPSIQSLTKPDKHLYMALGHSGEFNSGVIYARQQPQVIEWLERVLASRGDNLPGSDPVGWGENGHIIQHSKGCDFVSTMDTCWNNTFDPLMADYIRHFNHGPLRGSLALRLVHKALNRLSGVIAKLRPEVKKGGLALLSEQVKHHYADWFRPIHFDFEKN